MTNDQLPLVRSLITEILRREGPQPGSRLKTLLDRAHLAKTGQSFHERQLGFAKFSQLLQAQPDLLSVERSAAGPGDVIVRLREPAAAPAWTAAPGRNSAESVTQSSWGPRPDIKVAASTAAIQPWSAKRSWPISKPLWSAFINPDPNRERYLHRPTTEVLTFSRISTKSVDALMRQRVELLRSDCIPIDFIRFDVQLGWMEEFVRSRLPDGGRDGALDDVRRLNQWTAQTGFLNLVGYERAEDWRNFRFERVVARIREWLATNGLPDAVMMSAVSPLVTGGHPSNLLAGVSGREARVSTSSSAFVAVGARPSVRDLLHALIDSLPDDQLDSVLVPGSAVAKLSSIVRSIRG